MKLPLVLSVPHAGLTVPPEVRDACVLTIDEIRADGDAGAREIYALEDEVAAFLTTEVARAVVDLNRAPDDRCKDGVVKTHTCWDVPVYDPFPSEEVVAELLARYYHPYHARLDELAAGDGLLLGVDGHTMAAHGPPVGPDPGRERPAACVSNADGTCPAAWAARLADCLAATLERPVTVNDPFRGGYIVRSHAGRLPWVQLELSRAPYLDEEAKRERVLAALARFCRELGR